MNLTTGYQVIKHLGPGWVAYRFWKASLEKIGWWQWRLPSQPWQQFDLAQLTKSDCSIAADAFLEKRTSDEINFFFAEQDLQCIGQRSSAWDPSPQWVGDTEQSLLAGKTQYFSSRLIEQNPPDWFRNPYTHQVAPADLHFSQINEFGFGDVKTIWELSRFGFVFDLIRVYARNRSQACAEFFWNRFENWTTNNPPYQGINWKCGQEAALRAIACLFAFHTFLANKATTNERLDLFLKFVHATAMRIERNIGYAISQKNNHGISEAAVLWGLGTLFPEFKRAQHWRHTGGRILGRLCQELIYDDGGFSQYSANYHRLLLHILAWAVRLDTINQRVLPSIVKERFELASDFLHNLVDPHSGAVPRYGNDDGALLLPLNHSGYQDYRPVTQLCHAVQGRKPPWQNGAWNEDLVWFGLDGDSNQQPAAKPRARKFQARLAGCHVLTDKDSSAMIRAGNFIHRPSQLDMFHVDIFHRGQNVVLDPGTYTYNGSGVWKNLPFSQQRYHNTVRVDGLEPARQVSKFLFLPWNRCTELEQGNDSNCLAFQRQLQSRSGKPVTHNRRLIGCSTDCWIVIDQLSCEEECEYTLHWLLADALKAGMSSDCTFDFQFEDGEPYFFQWLTSDGSPDTAAEASLVKGAEDSADGWFAPRYLELSPANSFTAVKTAADATFISYFGPRPLDETSRLTIKNSLAERGPWIVRNANGDRQDLP